MKIVWLGHSFFLIYANNKKILVDPFISGNSKFPASYEKEVTNPDYIAVTHGHSDHIVDTVRLYDPKRTKVISNVEICTWLNSKGVTNCIGMNIGGTYEDSKIKFSMVQAIHSSGINDNGETIYGGLAAGFIIKYMDRSVYHFGDTNIFEDMKIIQDLYSPEIGLIPVGGKYTMPPAVAAKACNDYFNFKTVIPMHYGTFPAIDINVQDFVNSINNKDSVLVLKPGDLIEV